MSAPSLDSAALLAAIQRAEELYSKQTLTNIILPSEYMKAFRDSTAAEVAARQEAAMPSILGHIKVFESEYARLPAKRHKKRKWMRESYHRRIQKKWTKRWGTVPAAFAFAADALKVDFTKPFPSIQLKELSSFGGYGALMINTTMV